jgi:hypothetical protein
VTTATGSCAAIAAATSSSCGNVSRSTRSTNSSMMPPQVNPTANASSSLMPYLVSTGSPVRTTSDPSS